jgi:acetylornithine/LysW-gamma-L-lysine aminotransferase
MTGFVFGEKPVEIAGGDGVHLHSADGTEYLDAGASYACAPVGHCHPEVVAAVEEQASELLYVQGSYPTAVRDALHGRLADLAPGGIDTVWLCNSGTEAVEAALKFARHATGRESVVAAKRAFHGRTLGALAATWKPAYREGFAVPEHVEFVDYGDPAALRAAVGEDTAAVLLEPIQGEGGVHPAPDGYLAAAREACDDAGAALVFDEIQTGLGRTGAMWACQRNGVTPDILTTAKGLASGLPMGATLCADWVAENAGDHGSTFAGGPVPCAAALATLDVLEGDGLPAHAAEVGASLRDSLADLAVRDVRGAGLMVGVEVKRGAPRVLRSLALESGVLALQAGRTTVRLLPPLTVREQHTSAIVDAMEGAL